MDEIMTSMNQLTGGGIDQGVQQIQSVAQQNSTLALIITVAVGLVICFFGLKLVPVLAAVSGLCVGLVIGIPIAQLIGLEGLAFGAVMLVCAVIVAVLSCKIYRIGIFLWTLFMGAGAVAVFIQPNTLLLAAICLAAGLVIAIVTVIFLEPLVIIVSSLCGGLSAGTAAAALAGFNGNIPVMYGIAVVLAVLGMVVQFMMRSREIGKKERIHATQFRAKASRETEVEKARKMLEEDEESKEDNEEDDDIKFVE